MKEKIIELRKNGKTYNEIKLILGCSKSTISYHCSKISENESIIKENMLVRRLKENNNFLLQDIDIEKIIELRKENKTLKEIKEITNNCYDAIKLICYEFKSSKYGKYLTKSQDAIDNINDTYNEIKTIKGVSDKLGIAKITIKKYLNEENLEDLNNRKNKIRYKTNSNYVVDWRKRKKIELLEYKGGKCEICGYNKCIRSLEFHHRDPKEKDFTISGKSWSFERLKSEVDKCMLVCSNCHNEIHYELEKNNNNGRYPSGFRDQSDTLDTKV